MGEYTRAYVEVAGIFEPTSDSVIPVRSIAMGCRTSEMQPEFLECVTYPSLNDSLAGR